MNKFDKGAGEIMTRDDVIDKIEADNMTLEQKIMAAWREGFETAYIAIDIDEVSDEDREDELQCRWIDSNTAKELGEAIS